MNTPHYKTPRLYYPQELSVGSIIRLEGTAHHYLRNVMRKNAGDIIRVFNAEYGEFAAELHVPHKKYIDALVTDQIRPAVQGAKGAAGHITLACPILPKDRMDMMIEKSVELGVSAIQPLIFEHSSVRKIKEERVEAQIIEAAEQCERLDIPRLLPLASFDAFLRQNDTVLIAALERDNVEPMGNVLGVEAVSSAANLTYLVGPEGGVSEAERLALGAHAHMYPVCLGVRILRAETAALYGLSLMSALLPDAT